MKIIIDDENMNLEGKKMDLMFGFYLLAKELYEEGVASKKEIINMAQIALETKKEREIRKKDLEQKVDRIRELLLKHLDEAFDEDGEKED